MKRVIKICLAGALLLCPAVLRAERPRVQGLLQLQGSAASLGRGGCAVSSEGADLFNANPASIGALGNWSLGAEYGSPGGGPENPSAYLAFPTSYGVLGFSSRFFRYDDSSGAGQRAFQADAGGARELYPGLLLGAAAHVTGAEFGESRVLYGGLRLGVLVKLLPGGGGGAGFGAHGLGLGAALRLGGGSGGEAGDYDQASLGYNLLFYRNPRVTASFFNEASVLGDSSVRTVKAGLEAVLWGTVTARAGFIAPDRYGAGGYTLGAGLLVDVTDARCDLNYAWAFGDGEGQLHYLGLGISYNGPDTEPPRVDVRLPYPGFSPNGDGSQDVMIFRPDASDAGDLKGWRFQILNRQGRVVKEYRYQGRKRRSSLNPFVLGARIFTSREEPVVPGMIVWDGTDGAGHVHPDGYYSYSFTAWDQLDNIAESRTGHFIIDTVRPDVELKKVSLHADPRAGTGVVIEQKIKERNDDEVIVRVTDDRGGTVRSFAWKAAELPARFAWDALDAKGKPVKDGRYGYSITVRDRAGNGIVRRVENLIVDSNVYTAGVLPSADCYSPLPGRPLRFVAATEGKAAPAHWTLSIGGADGAPVRRLEGEGAPGALDWDGRDGRGNTVPDGVYLYKLELSAKDGTRGTSPTGSLLVDSSPPDVSLNVSPRVFSPDGDFHDDWVTLRPEARDPAGFDRWEIRFYAESGALYSVIAGEGEPSSGILWNGNGRNGALPFSMDSFYAELTAWDRAGNRAVSPRARITTDILLVPYQGMLRITFSDRSDPSNLRAEGRLNAVLARLARVLEDYPDYRIRIEAHTDFAGDDHVNLMTTEKKAKYVRDFLIRKGFGDREISFRGMGETEPVFGEEAGADRERNNRIELFLSPRAN